MFDKASPALAGCLLMRVMPGAWMHFDDRLATVLRSGATGERARRTQYRQLLDLLGTIPANSDTPAVQSAFERLDSLEQIIPARERARIIRDPGIRLSNVRLVDRLAQGDLAIAAAVMANARLEQHIWLGLIPDLPVRARGLLRHRRDLPHDVNRLLAKLGVTDMILSGPDNPVQDSVFLLDKEESSAEPTALPQAPVPPDTASPLADSSVPVSNAASTQPSDLGAILGEELNLEDNEAIGAIVRRIEAFRRAREKPRPVANSPADLPGDAPRLPLGEHPETKTRTILRAFDFSTNAGGHINWADPAAAPMAIGTSLASQMVNAPARVDTQSAQAMQRHLPITGGTLNLDGAPPIAGLWRMDATPCFDVSTGSFTGYFGRLRRKPAPLAPAEGNHNAADRIRQLLHELRTPVNAIQGFSEVIQQQVFGPAPHEYRALAANIAGDAARIMAGFDELDRLARLESNTQELEGGICDFAALLDAAVHQLAPFLKSRSSAIAIWGGEDSVYIPLARSDAELLAWRIMATLAGAVTAGEHLDLHIARKEQAAMFAFEIPASLAARDDIFAAAQRGGAQAVSAGLFGSGFTFRLARAEAQAAGGRLTREGDILQLWLPLLTGEGAPHSDGANDAEGPAKESA